jgi:hypothetical protein
MGGRVRVRGSSCFDCLSKLKLEHCCATQEQPALCRQRRYSLDNFGNSLLLFNVSMQHVAKSSECLPLISGQAVRWERPYTFTNNSRSGLISPTST